MFEAAAIDFGELTSPNEFTPSLSMFSTILQTNLGDLPVAEMTFGLLLSLVRSCNIASWSVELDQMLLEIHIMRNIQPLGFPPSLANFGTNTVVGKRRQKLVQVLVRFCATCERRWKMRFRQVTRQDVG